MTTALTIEGHLLAGLSQGVGGDAAVLAKVRLFQVSDEQRQRHDGGGGLLIQGYLPMQTLRVRSIYFIWIYFSERGE